MEGSGVARGTETLLSKIRGGSLPIGAHTTGSEALTNPGEATEQTRIVAAVHSGRAAVTELFRPDAPTAA